MIGRLSSRAICSATTLFPEPLGPATMRAYQRSRTKTSDIRDGVKESRGAWRGSREEKWRSRLFGFRGGLAPFQVPKPNGPAGRSHRTEAELGVTVDHDSLRQGLFRVPEFSGGGEAQAVV